MKVWIYDNGDGDILLFKTREGALNAFGRNLKNYRMFPGEREQAIASMARNGNWYEEQIYEEEVFD